MLGCYPLFKVLEGQPKNGVTDYYINNYSSFNIAELIQMEPGTLYDVKSLIEACRNEPNPDRRLKILLVINAMLPPTKKLHVPSFLTDDYIARALHEIEKALCSGY